MVQRIPEPLAAPEIRPGLPVPALLARLGIRPRKRLSQAFLIDERVARRVASAAHLVRQDEVLEVGSGLGILTRHLVRAAGRVVAVELDEKLARLLPDLLGHPAHLEVVWADILRFDPASYFRGPYKLVANLPYSITSPVVLRFLTVVRRPTLMVVMVQKEVAQRIAAGPGQLTYLAIAVQLLAEPRVLFGVPPTAFYPRPKVESAVLRLDVRERPAVPVDDVAGFLALVQKGFTQPRKTLANSLAQGLGWPRTRAEQVILAAGLQPTLRPQQLSLEDWARLFHSPLLAREREAAP